MHRQEIYDALADGSISHGDILSLWKLLLYPGYSLSETGKQIDGQLAELQIDLGDLISRHVDHSLGQIIASIKDVQGLKYTSKVCLDPQVDRGLD